MLIMVTTDPLTDEQFKIFHDAVTQHPKVEDWYRQNKQQWFLEFNNADNDLASFRETVRKQFNNDNPPGFLITTVHYYHGYRSKELWDFLGKHKTYKEPENKDKEKRAAREQEQDKYTIRPQDFIVHNAASLDDLTLDQRTKETVNAYFARLAFYKAASGKGITLPHNHRNLAISGAAGVGKSTLAKAMGTKLIENSDRKKHVFFAKPAQIIGRYRGHSQRNMQEILDSAEDGVVIFDEIDTYLDLDSDDRMVLNVLNTHLGDRPNRPVIIATLYDTNRKRFFDFNQGMQSRFPLCIPIDGQDTKTLREIFTAAVTRTGMDIEPQALQDVESLLDELRTARRGNFGHIREVDNVIGAIIDHMAQRHDANKDDFTFHITRADIPEYDRISGIMTRKNPPPASPENIQGDTAKPRIISFPPRK